jgi:hypothetical protein
MTFYESHGVAVRCLETDVSAHAVYSFSYHVITSIANVSYRKAIHENDPNAAPLEICLLYTLL